MAEFPVLRTPAQSLNLPVKVEQYNHKLDKTTLYSTTKDLSKICSLIFLTSVSCNNL